MSLSVIILTFNSERTIQKTLESALRVSDDVHIVDSFSTDQTLEMVKKYPINLVQHEFENYGVQRNWAIANLPLKYDWEFHLDADERLTGELIAEINSLKKDFPAKVDGYFIPRLVHFMGRPIRYGGMFPIWHMRLFKHGRGCCEDREYDQHFRVAGVSGRLKGAMIDDIRMSLSDWSARHLRWAEAEVKELCRGERAGRIPGNLWGTPVQKKRSLRDLYNRAPLLLRAFMLFFYRYFLKLGFLCGKEGLIFFVLQTFWFRFLIDAKLFEVRLERKNDQFLGS